MDLKKTFSLKVFLTFFFLLCLFSLSPTVCHASEWGGTITASAEWEQVESWSGQVSTSMKNWRQVESWTSWIKAPTSWDEVESWSGTIKAPAGGWDEVESWSGFISTSKAKWFETGSWTGSILIHSMRWDEVESWSQSMNTPSEWYCVENWSMSGKANVSSREIESWQGVLNASDLLSTSLKIIPSNFTFSPSNPVTLKAVLTDEDNNPVAGETIEWSVSVGEITPSSAKTDSNGEITVTYTPPDEGKENSVVISASFSGKNDIKSSSNISAGSVSSPTESNKGISPLLLAVIGALAAAGVLGSLMLFSGSSLMSFGGGEGFGRGEWDSLIEKFSESGKRRAAIGTDLPSGRVLKSAKSAIKRKGLEGSITVEKKGDKVHLVKS